MARRTHTQRVRWIAHIYGSWKTEHWNGVTMRRLSRAVDDTSRHQPMPLMERLSKKPTPPRKSEDMLTWTRLYGR